MIVQGFSDIIIEENDENQPEEAPVSYTLIVARGKVALLWRTLMEGYGRNSRLYFTSQKLHHRIR